MTKRIMALVLAFALALSLCVGALAEINVTKRELSQAEGLDKNVSHIVLILQDGERTDTLMLASINSKTGRAVMTLIDCDREIELTMEDGTTQTVALADVYAQGDKKSRGLLVCRELNELLGLNISTYMAMDVTQLPELVDAVGALNIELTQEEADALGKSAGLQPLGGEDVLSFVRLSLEGDDPARSRSYDALMQMLYQAMHSGDLMGLISLGTKMLGSIDTNMGALMALPLVTAVQGGDDRRELTITASEPATEAEIQDLVRREIYE